MSGTIHPGHHILYFLVTNYMISLLKQFLLLPHKLKAAYKKRLFQKNAKMGPDVAIYSTANIKCETGSIISIAGHNDLLCNILAMGGGKVFIGAYTTIRAHSVVGAVKSIKIGNHVIISNNVHIYDNNNHPTAPEVRYRMCESGFYSSEWDWEKSVSAEVIIEDNVWIGERSTILKGVTIGKGSIIACDSVVTKSVPPYCIAAGNPAKVVKYLEPSIITEHERNVD